MSVEMKCIRPLGNDRGKRVNGQDNLGYDKNKEFDSMDKAIDTDNVTVAMNKDEPEEDDYDYNGYQQAITETQKAILQYYCTHKTVIRTILALHLGLAYFVYFGFAMRYRFGDEGSWRLLVCTVLGVATIVLVILNNAYETEIDNWWQSTKDARESNCMKRFGTSISWFLRIGVLVFIVVYVIIDIAIDHPQNLISVAGLLLCLLIFYITSVNPARVNWHTVYWGIALQYLFALMILRTQWGYEMFKWAGDRVAEFLEHVMTGVLFLFGEEWFQHFFAMKVLSIVVFFYTVINILYYLGVMQAIIKVLGRFLAFCMQTTPAESINAAANIFVALTDSPLLIKPLLKDMTRSELHAVMTGGFATIAGSVLGAYISYGVPANHLLSASVMSAPAALAISKLSYPEVQISKGSKNDFSKMGKAPEHNIIEAASNGATWSIKIISAIAVNVLAFLSMLAFLNATLTWLGDRVGIEELTFELICSYVLYPVAYFMGVETGDCRKVAELIGVKTFTNEFIAYGHLKILLQNRKDLYNYTEFYNTTDWYWQNNDVVLGITGQVLDKGFISEKSEIISTYALCGFANFGSIGITLGALGTMVPSRRSDLTKMVLRAMICGNAACILTACIAGLLYKPF